MPVFSINKTLAAIQLLAQSGTQENAERVAGLIGVQLVAKNAIVEYTTKKGKVIRGVVRTDLSYAEAKAIDEFTFKKDGGWFVREKHLGGTQAQDSPAIEPSYPSENATDEEWETYNKAMDKLSPLNIKGMQIVGTPKTLEQRQLESRNATMADYQKRIDMLPVGVRRSLAHDIYKEIAESKGAYVDGGNPINLKPNDTSDKVAYYKDKANKEPRNKGVNVGYSDSKDYALDRKALRELAANGLYADDYLDTETVTGLKDDALISEQLSPVAGITHDSENSPRSPYDKLTPAFAAKPNQVADIVYEAKDAKKILIDTLKKAFPSVLFSVKKSYHGRNGDYTVSWLDGASETLVKRVLSHFVGYQQGAMDVSMDFRLHGHYLMAKNDEGQTVSYGFRELETHRKTSSKFLKGVLSQFSEGKDGEYAVAINNEVFKKYGFRLGSGLYKVVDSGDEGQLLTKDYYGNWHGASHDLIEQFSTAKYNSHTTAAKNRGSNVSSSSNPLESDSNTGSRPDTQSSIENSNANESAEFGRMARPSIDRPDEGGGVQRDSSVGLSENDGIGIGTASDSIVSDGSGQRGVGERDNASDGGGSDSVNEPRSPVVAKRDAAVVRATTRDTSSDDIKLKEQLEAEGVATKWGDADSIDKALPYLLPEQRDDVVKAEKRLIDDNKNGMLFTNGTGTGKTFTGLGIAKRFANAGKKNILIVSMNDKIIRDFVKSAKSLNLDVHQLDGINDNGGANIVATTYANLGQNLKLGLRDWDLIIVDEAHNLMQGEQGKETEALGKLRALTGHHEGFDEWFDMRHGDKTRTDFVIGQDEITRQSIIDEDAFNKWWDFKKSLRKEWEQTWTNQSGKTKVIFLSATPFSYAKTLEWGEGYLFDFEPPEKKFSKKEENLTYNAGSPREQFYMNTFGYKMRYNRLTRPDGRVDVGILERKFAEKLKTEGAMSGRDLSVPFDYDRKFVLIDSKIGEKIDEGFNFLWSEKDKDGEYKYGDLLRALNRQFDYLSRIQLLEAIKADAAIDQIKKHIALGRKVIVFHDYNVGGGTNPFVLLGGGADEEAAAQYEAFQSARPDLMELELDLDAPITALKRVFSGALLFNGTVSKGQRAKNADLFNSDNNGHNLLIAQSDAAATGISLHDTTGKFQRVIINIGMPSKPAKLRQTEGRIYRVGQASNAIQRYLTTGTNWERSTFSQKIAERAETVDNLAQGESAVVSIKDALVQAYEEAEYFEPSENDGIGGKAYDEENARINKLTPFERAKTDYWVKQKVTAKRQDREGKEWYATPEPVGLFMVNLSGAHSGDDILEPSAGDGAIGRYMPSDASVTFIEPSESLASRARMNNTNANVIVDGFENHGSNNKYDAIVMNPPFGQGGSIAIKHLVKAFEHLRDGGRVVALLPVGKMDELIVKYHEMGYFKDIYTVAEFALPSSTFKNAGTGVNTKIHVFERHNFKGDAPQGIISKNLSHYDNIEDLFGAIENINIKPRKPRIDEALAEYGLEIYPERSKYIITGEGLKRKDITTTLFGTFGEKNKDGDYVEKYNRSTAFLKWLKDSQIPNMAQFNNGLSFNNLPIKYQQKTNKYNTWDGVGSMPDWLKGFISYNGAKLEDFAVEKPVFDSLSSGVSLMETLALITSLSKKKDDAVAQQLAVAIGVRIKKPSPIFETYKDALDWISEQSKKYASEKAFKSTDLYKSVYEQINVLYEQENLLYKQEKAKISAAKIKQMRDAGIDVGDKVKAFVMGSFLNGQTHYGVVVLRDGYPYVKLNEKVTVSSKGKLRDTSFVAWNDRWVKDAPTRGEREAEKAETKQEQPQDKVIANNETNWIGADKAFSKNIDNDYGPSGAISEAVDFAKSSPKGTTTLETIIRPNGNKWHTLYLSNGKGGLAIKSIGGKQTESLESVVAYLEDEIKKESESAEVFAQNKRKEEISNNKIAEKEGFVVGLKLGTIIPNTNRKIRQAYIAKNNNDGTFDVEGLFGNKPVIIKGMSALGIKDAIQRHQNTQTKQPETKTEPKAKIDFSEASVKLEDAPTNTASQTKPTKKYKSGSREWQNFCRDASIKYARLYQSYMNNKTDYDSFFKKKELSPLSDDAIKNIERVVGRDFYKWREIDVVQYDLKTEYLQTKDDFNDIGDFNSATSNTSIMDTLNAIVALAKNNSQANAEKLAKLLGVKLAPKQELDMFGDPIQSQGFDLFGEPIQDGDDSPVEELPRLAVVELPLNKLKLSEDVPQFKSGVEDSDTGVVEALGGKFDRTGVAPIQVWERLDGRLEIISGRHRTDLARRSGEKTIPAQVHKESEGFTAKQAMMLDAELNIRDGQGKVKDYVDYFTHSEISEDEADKRGLLARSIGQRAFTIASKGSEELLTLHRNDIISDQAAADIANIAPNNSAMQAVGLRVLQEHKPLNNALNTIRAVMALTREKGQEPDTFDLFGFDDSALKEAEAMAKVASRKQRQIAEQLTAIKGAVKNPKLAAKHGVIVENEADAIAKVQTMTAQKARWDNWSSHADLLAEVRSELNNKLDSIFDEDEYYWLCQEELDLIAA